MQLLVWKHIEDVHIDALSEIGSSDNVVHTAKKQIRIYHRKITVKTVCIEQLGLNLVNTEDIPYLIYFVVLHLSGNVK